MSPPPSDAEPLTAYERTVLARIATAERAADPRFAAGLTTGRQRRDSRTVRWTLLLCAVIVGAVVAGLALGPWGQVAVIVMMLVVVPTALVTWALHQERHPRR